jgi:hypothetical protein
VSSHLGLEANSSYLHTIRFQLLDFQHWCRTRWDPERVRGMTGRSHKVVVGERKLEEMACSYHPERGKEEQGEHR